MIEQGRQGGLSKGVHLFGGLTACFRQAGDFPEQIFPFEETSPLCKRAGRNFDILDPDTRTTLDLFNVTGISFPRAQTFQQVRTKRLPSQGRVKSGAAAQTQPDNKRLAAGALFSDKVPQRPAQAVFQPIRTGIGIRQITGPSA